MSSMPPSDSTPCRSEGARGRTAAVASCAAREVYEVEAKGYEASRCPAEAAHEGGAMKLTGHKTDSVFRRYDIVSPDDLRVAVERLDAINAVAAR